MLDRIMLEHFKCFEKLKLPLRPLTLLTGLNASGKSTTLQALALLHQTLSENPSSPGLVLNGKDVTLGSADELVDKIAGRNRFGIGLEHNDVDATWQMLVENDSLLAAFGWLEWHSSHTGVTSAEIAPAALEEWERYEGRNTIKATVSSQEALTVTGATASEALTPLLTTLRSLTYISADRIGPRETYPASSSAQQSGVGARGEYTPWFIHQHQDLEIPSAMRYPETPPLLNRQVEAWLGSFFPGSGLEIEPLPRTNLLVMRLRTSSATNYHRPANVGYGLSHVLPVITACLGAVGLAQRDAQVAPLVMIENPELHLHPAGQSAMGVFLARAAATGAQVIIETHSDHVLNGIRRAVKGIDGVPILDPAQVAIHFFQPRDDTRNQPQVISPLIDSQGNLSSWPENFFDQYDRDLSSLIGW